MANSLLMRGLFGEDYDTSTPLRKALGYCRWIRAKRAWITSGSYGWYRFTDDLKNAQRALLKFREGR